MSVRLIRDPRTTAKQTLMAMDGLYHQLDVTVLRLYDQLILKFLPDGELVYLAIARIFALPLSHPKMDIAYGSFLGTNFAMHKNM